ncbi:flagellar hook-length control protein FliK [Desulfobulbus rhabdoformis]|uniref:flagellar hook-length control protein FliK n=1 Tax=Desulfobulbus rhabdoformis TaxID=34032 RepID=UPI001966C356|nr:flagellar hook-length control protein FliK [Desulfobulbus rhabdoformis]MBM9616480.1 flagellar hook-length control protein FliK [Desulfobulbus rhabdoformis]
MLAQITAPQSNAAQQEQTIQVVSAPLPSSQKTTSAAAFENTKADPQVLPGQWTQLAPKGNLQQEQASTVQWSQQTLSSQTSPVAASGQEPLQNQSAGPGTTFSIPTESEPISVQASTGAQVIFNPKDGTIVTSTTPQQQQRADEILKSPESSLLFQNKDGQSISIEQGKDPLQSQPPATALSGNQTLYQKAANLDLNSRYIHSHLISTPTATTAVDNQSMGSDQSQSGMLFDGNQKFQAMQDMKPISLFQEGGVQTLGTSLFGTQLASSQLTSMTTLTSGAETTYYQLGSGSMVPDTAVVDQMISHFSANKQLETSTVNLKLHPQELGELRLEIKVEQDNVKAHIVTQSPHSQEMLDRHLPKLREALEQQGLHLQDIEVSVADGNAGFEEQFANNSGWQQSQQSMSQRNTRSDFSMELTEEAGEEEDVDTNFNAIA